MTYFQKLKPTNYIECSISIEEKKSSMKLINQIHGTKIIVIENNEKYDELLKNPIEADGIISYLKKEIFVFTADCLAVLFFGNETSPIAAIHCGWRGAMKGIVSKTLSYYEKNGIEPSAIIGPSIKKCCFEVKNDFIDSFTKEKRFIDNYIEHRDKKIFFDLEKYVIETELKNLPKNKIDTSLTRCSFCSKPALPSYRRNKNTDTVMKCSIKKY